MRNIVVNAVFNPLIFWGLAALSAENRPNFFGFNTSIPGPLASEVLKGFGAVKSEELNR